MYDILQLNDMFVPELLDIAEQLKIPNAKKLDKQGLVYKILDSQALAGSKAGSGAEDKGKRKRIIKTSTGNITEEAVVEESSTPHTSSAAHPAGDDKKTIKKPHMAIKKEVRPDNIEEKTPIKRGRKKPDEKETADGNISEQQAEAPEVNNNIENGGSQTTTDETEQQSAESPESSSTAP